MNENSFPNPEQTERLIDLLIQRATLGLPDAEQQELDQLSSSFDSEKEFKKFEIAVAAFDLSFDATEEIDVGQGGADELPEHLRDQVLISAGQFFSDDIVSNVDSQIEPSTQISHPERAGRNTAPAMRWREILPLAAMAASLLLVFSGYNPFAAKPNKPVAVISVIERMETFTTSAPSDLVDWDWQPVHNKNASGKVLWSDTAQEGYMVFKDMKINDPTVEQFQLWIFDNDPAQATPIDGGVFDISNLNRTPEGNVIVPIRPTVPVGRAVQFAVTIETPGGVYVSEREQIPVLANPAESP